jgi:hypothetical protein
MYPYDYLREDGGLSAVLLVPLIIAVLVAKHLPKGVRNFLWKNYWWICGLALMWVGSSYTTNISLIFIYGGVGAYAGLLGASGFNPKDFGDSDHLEKPAASPSSPPSLVSGGVTNRYESSIRQSNTIKVHNTKASSGSTGSTINPQKQFYGDEARKNQSHSISFDLSPITEPTTISGSGWKHDKNLRVLWNDSTNEMLRGVDGLGYSSSGGFFILYNKVKPRRVLQSEVMDTDFSGELED